MYCMHLVSSGAYAFMIFPSSKFRYHKSSILSLPSLVRNSHSFSQGDCGGGFNPMWENLLQSVTVKVAKAEGRPLNVPLIDPFTIASSRLEAVNNVAIRVELDDGSVGWGEAPILPGVTAEDQPLALEKAREACQLLQTNPAKPFGVVLQGIDDHLPGHAFASIPIVAPIAAAELAAKYAQLGFETLKLKVGKNLTADIDVLKAIRNTHPTCSFVLDANEGYTSSEAIEVLKQLHGMGVTPILFEQPVARNDWVGLGDVSKVAREVYGVSVAADESCRSLADVQKIIEERLADVVNIKLAKLGVRQALDIIKVATKAGLKLMIGGMVETRLAIGFSGHLAAGLGCFKFIDLDTPLLLAQDPVIGGYKVDGPVYKFGNAGGHGGYLDWDRNE